MKKTPRRAVIVGATSGIGYEIALLLVQEGWRLGIAGRRKENLEALQAQYPDQICIRAFDIRQSGAEKELEALIDELGGMDLFLQSSGIGFQNYALDPEIELNTLETNGTGFARMVTHAFRYFLQKGSGHLAVISSIAGTKGLGIAPAYSATKRFQNTYLMPLSNWPGCTRCPFVLPTSGRDSWLPDCSTTGNTTLCSCRLPMPPARLFPPCTGKNG